MESVTELSNGFTTDGLKKHTELDLIPTKITSIEPDPVLLVTPEKKTFEKWNKKRTKDSSNIATTICKDTFAQPDPDLVITPEKLPSLLKPNLSKGTKLATKHKVRFDVPESSDEAGDSVSPTTHSSYNESSSLSTENDDFSQTPSDFGTKAALLTQRNPLADITLDSNHIFDSSTSTGTNDGTSSTLNSTTQQFNNSDLSNFQKSFASILDMKGKKFTQKQPSKATIEPQRATTATSIQTTGRKSGQRKKTPAQVKIDKLTVPTTSAEKVAGPSSYLKKKSGLHRHQHSIKYISKIDDVKTNCLAQPKYNSSLAIGQKLQIINEERFDAMEAVLKKLDTDKELKNHVATKAAEGTNVDPDEYLYKNLVSVDVPREDIALASEFRRVKRPQPLKVPSMQEPNIMDLFPEELISEKIILESKCFTLPKVYASAAPLDSVRSLYTHSTCWDYH